MKVKILNVKPVVVSARNLPSSVKEKISQNLEKLKESKTEGKTRNCDLDSKSARITTTNTTLNKSRANSRILLKKDPLHEQKLRRELTIFRREAEFKFRKSYINKTYSYPRTKTDNDNLSIDDHQKLKDDIRLLIISINHPIQNQ